MKLDLAGMASGQQAGLVHYSGSWCCFGITQNGSIRTLTYSNGGHITSGPAVGQNTLWLRSSWGFDGQSRFSYSLNGKSFMPFGDPYLLTWGEYRGDRIGLYSFNDQGESGYVDVDWFLYTVTR